MDDIKVVKHGGRYTVTYHKHAARCTKGGAKMVTIQSQNFGVEIEMTGVSRGTAASVIANYFGVGGIHFAGGTYQTYEAKDSKGRVWKCMRDGSITPRRRIGGAIVEADDTYRCEVVTPILQYEDITDLQEVIRALVKKGAMANSSCGIHVHVDGANHTPKASAGC
mgnify:CR=1 FL=1